MRPTQQSSDAGLAAVAARQHGVVSSTQLRGLGLTKQNVAWRAAAGRLHPLHRGVYAVGHAALSLRAV